MNTLAVTLRKIKRPSRGGKTREEWALRWHDSEGRHRCERVGDVKSMPKREAETFRRQKQVDMQAKRVPRDKPRSMTIGQFTVYHKEMIGKDRKPRTRYEYELSLRYVTNTLGEDYPLRNLGVSEAGKVRRHIKGGDATRAKHISRLRAIFNQAVKWELLDKNPFKDQPMPRFGPRKMRIFKPHEIEAMLDTSKTPWWRAYLLVGFTTGLRREEIANLMWADVDLEELTLQVTPKRVRQVTVNGSEYATLAWTPKDYELRTIPIPERTVAALQELRRGADDSPYVFVDLGRLDLINQKMEAGERRERAETLNNVLRDFRSIQSRAAATLEDLSWMIGTLHDMRRTYATTMAGVVPMHVLKELMGHADIATTAMYYLQPGSHHADLVRRTLMGTRGK